MNNSEETSMVIQTLEGDVPFTNLSAQNIKKDEKPLNNSMKKRLAKKKEKEEEEKHKKLGDEDEEKELSEFEKLKLKFNEGFDEIFGILENRIKDNKDWEEIRDSFKKCKEHDMEFLDSKKEFFENNNNNESNEINIQKMVEFVISYYYQMFKKYKNYSKNYNSYSNNCERIFDIYHGSDKSIDLEKKLRIDEIDCVFEILFNITHGKVFKFYPKIYIFYHTDVPGHWMEENGFNDYTITLWRYIDSLSCDSTMGLLKCLFNSLINMKELKYCKIKNQLINKNEKNVHNAFFSVFENMDINHLEICSICMENTTTDFPCGHYCCLKCKIQLYKNNKNKISCPCCRKNFAYKWLLTTDFYEKNRKSKYYHELEMNQEDDSDDE